MTDKTTRARNPAKQAAGPTDAELSQFLLPHVRDAKKGEWRHPRHWWALGDPIDKDRNHPIMFCNYTMDCFVGDALAQNLLAVCRRFPSEATMLIQMTLHDMIAVGRLSGVEVAFTDTLAVHLARSLRGAPLAVVANHFGLPAGGAGRSA